MTLMEADGLFCPAKAEIAKKTVINPTRLKRVMFIIYSILQLSEPLTSNPDCPPSAILPHARLYGCLDLQSHAGPLSKAKAMCLQLNTEVQSTEAFVPRNG
ncbi:MAG TPA: hypothetical protein VKL99_02565 [Candidatus Angelobacter sp.]|nr:hypothetical protein [Candidatus Angelobacter sp.]